MRIEDKVVSLELAKRMKELGWDYETERCWILYQGIIKKEWVLFNIRELFGEKTIKKIVKSQKKFCKYYPAPDVIEIGEGLPKYLYAKDIVVSSEQVGQRQLGHLCLGVIGGKTDEKSCWHISYERLVSGKGDKPIFNAIFGLTEAEARGKMWCYLKERKLI